MPQFLEQRYGTRIRTLMAVFWLGAVRLREPDLDHLARLDRGDQGRRRRPDDGAGRARRCSRCSTSSSGGLKAVALTDIVQVTLLVLGGLMVSGI